MCVCLKQHFSTLSVVPFARNLALYHVMMSYNMSLPMLSHLTQSNIHRTLNILLISLCLLNGISLKPPYVPQKKKTIFLLLLLFDYDAALVIRQFLDAAIKSSQTVSVKKKKRNKKQAACYN